METNNSLKAGTVSGTLLSMVPNLLSEDVLRTILLAIIGAVVSFTVTVILKWITGFKKK